MYSWQLGLQRAVLGLDNCSAGTDTKWLHHFMVTLQTTRTVHQHAGPATPFKTSHTPADGAARQAVAHNLRRTKVVVVVMVGEVVVVLVLVVLVAVV